MELTKYQIHLPNKLDLLGFLAISSSNIINQNAVSIKTSDLSRDRPITLISHQILKYFFRTRTENHLKFSSYRLFVFVISLCLCYFIMSLLFPYVFVMI